MAIIQVARMGAKSFMIVLSLVVASQVLATSSQGSGTINSSNATNDSTMPISSTERRVSSANLTTIPSTVGKVEKKEKVFGVVAVPSVVLSRPTRALGDGEKLREASDEGDLLTAAGEKKYKLVKKKPKHKKIKMEVFEPKMKYKKIKMKIPVKKMKKKKVKGYLVKKEKHYHH